MVGSIYRDSRSRNKCVDYVLWSDCRPAKPRGWPIREPAVRSCDQWTNLCVQHRGSIATHFSSRCILYSRPCRCEWYRLLVFGRESLACDQSGQRNCWPWTIGKSEQFARWNQRDAQLEIWLYRSSGRRNPTSNR